MKRVWAGMALVLAAVSAPLYAPLALGQTAAPPTTTPPAQTAAAAAKDAEARAALILAADIDGFVAKTRANPDAAKTASGAIIVSVDQIGAGDYAGASATIAALTSRRQRQTVGDLLDMWSLLLQGKKQEAYAKATEAKPRLAAGLGDVAVPLIMEAGGDLPEAAAAYAKLIGDLNTSPLPTGMPADADAARRVLAAPRMAQVIYRAAMVNHRLGQRDEALKYYLLADQFAPNSPDIADNLDRLARGAQPREARLDARSGFGRWMFFTGYQFALDFGLRRSQAGEAVGDPIDALVGPLYAQIGLRYAPQADEWRVSIANELINAGGTAGATKLLAPVPADSPFAPDVKIAQANIALGAKDDARAATAARDALKLGAARWEINLDAGRILAIVGRDGEALTALNAAVEEAEPAPVKAQALLARAGAHHQAGRLTEAGKDARAALAADDEMSVRMSAAGYLSMAPDGWFEAIRLAREVVFARPRSIDAINTLGYALIQKEQGLDEGFKLLSQGAQQSPDHYPIVDSLGWAYYNFGDFENARLFVSKANDLSKDDPNSEVLDHLGDIYWRLKRPEDAKKAWRQALTVRPDATRRADLEKKLASGLTAPAPAKRSAPLVDYNPYRSPPDRGPI